MAETRAGMTPPTLKSLETLSRKPEGMTQRALLDEVIANRIEKGEKYAAAMIRRMERGGWIVNVTPRRKRENVVWRITYEGVQRIKREHERLAMAAERERKAAVWDLPTPTMSMIVDGTRTFLIRYPQPKREEVWAYLGRLFDIRVDDIARFLRCSDGDVLIIAARGEAHIKGFGDNSSFVRDLMDGVNAANLNAQEAQQSTPATKRKEGES